jgi:hypothetical protein
MAQNKINQEAAFCRWSHDDCLLGLRGHPSRFPAKWNYSGCRIFLLYQMNVNTKAFPVRRQNYREEISLLCTYGPINSQTSENNWLRSTWITILQSWLSCQWISPMRDNEGIKRRPQILIRWVDASAWMEFPQIASKHWHDLRSDPSNFRIIVSPATQFLRQRKILFSPKRNWLLLQFEP